MLEMMLVIQADEWERRAAPAITAASVFEFNFFFFFFTVVVMVLVISRNVFRIVLMSSKLNLNDTTTQQRDKAPSL